MITITRVLAKQLYSVFRRTFQLDRRSYLWALLDDSSAIGYVNGAHAAPSTVDRVALGQRRRNTKIRAISNHKLQAQ